MEPTVEPAASVGVFELPQNTAFVSQLSSSCVEADVANFFFTRAGLRPVSCYAPFLFYFLRKKRGYSYSGGFLLSSPQRISLLFSRSLFAYPTMRGRSEMKDLHT
jgi:hypothetical protein